MLAVAAYGAPLEPRVAQLEADAVIQDARLDALEAGGGGGSAPTMVMTNLGPVVLSRVVSVLGLFNPNQSWCVVSIEYLVDDVRSPTSMRRGEVARPPSTSQSECSNVHVPAIAAQLGFEVIDLN